MFGQGGEAENGSEFKGIRYMNMDTKAKMSLCLIILALIKASRRESTIYTGPLANGIQNISIELAYIDDETTTREETGCQGCGSL